MIALEGKVKNNSIALDQDISAYDGNTVIVTILDRPVSHRRRKIDLDSYAHRTERGQNADQYISGLRDHDRI